MCTPGKTPAATSCPIQANANYLRISLLNQTLFTVLANAHGCSGDGSWSWHLRQLSLKFSKQFGNTFCFVVALCLHTLPSTYNSFLPILMVALEEHKHFLPEQWRISPKSGTQRGNLHGNRPTGPKKNKQLRRSNSNRAKSQWRFDVYENHHEAAHRRMTNFKHEETFI